MNNSYEVVFYKDVDETIPLKQWLVQLHDARAVLKITTRVYRMEAGNFGDHKSLGGGLYELRVDYGPGYRIYYCLQGSRIVLLLCGGDKRKQSADVNKARAFKTAFEEQNS